MVQLLPDLERNLVRRGFKILPSFIVMNFVGREWSMCSVNWISRGPEAWAQMRSTSTGWRSSAVKDTKHRPWGRKCRKSCKWGETSGACMHWRLWTSLRHLLTLWTEIFVLSLSFSQPFDVQSKSNKPKKASLLTMQQQLTVCSVQVKNLSAEGGVILMRTMSKENIWVHWK